ncbi:hypothetical protein ACH5Y9_11730 [Methylomonas sp. BW4-1]|uniref:hypothetical protein n=1 Tax=Methylomonas sp. BW4-1 TaxID=3376685 RepID=UPI004041ECB6
MTSKSMQTPAAHLRLLNAMFCEVTAQYCKAQAAQGKAEAGGELAALSPMVKLFDETIGLVWSEKFELSAPLFDYCPKIHKPTFEEVAKRMDRLTWHLENIGQSEAFFTRPWLGGLLRLSANLVGSVDWLLGELDPAMVTWAVPAENMAETPAVSGHRLSPLGGADNALAHVDTVNMMANKALSILSMLGNAVAGEDDQIRPSDDDMYYALRSVGDELTDIKAVVSAFHQATKSQHA